MKIKTITSQKASEFDDAVNDFQNELARYGDKVKFTQTHVKAVGSEPYMLIYATGNGNPCVSTKTAGLLWIQPTRGSGGLKPCWSFQHRHTMETSDHCMNS